MGPSDRDVPEAAGASRAVVLRSELQSSGVSITDVPEGGDSIYKILLGKIPNLPNRVFNENLKVFLG